PQSQEPEVAADIQIRRGHVQVDSHLGDRVPGVAVDGVGRDEVKADVRVDVDAEVQTEVPAQADVDPAGGIETQAHSGQAKVERHVKRFVLMQKQLELHARAIAGEIHLDE